MLYIRNPYEDVKEMKAFASLLQQYSPPKYPHDEDISWLKSRDIVVDGYTILAHFSITDNGDYSPAVLTLASKQCPYIPFYVVIKCAKMFLGEEYLTLFEYRKGNSKIYSWLSILQDGKVTDNFDQSNLVKDSYQGFEFFRSSIDSNLISL